MIIHLFRRGLTAWRVVANALVLLAVSVASDPYISRAAEPPRLAIIGFVSSADNSRLREQNRSLIDLVTALLSQGGDYALVERAEMEKIFQEQDLAAFQTPNLKDAVRLGSLLRADRLLMGSVIGRGNTNVLLAQLVDVNSGIIRAFIFLPIDTSGLPALAEPLARFVSRAALPGKPDLFLAVGTFEDMSIKTEFPNYGHELRALLIQSFGRTNVSLVERSIVNPLLTELRLGMLGLGAKTKETNSAQPAFVLLDGLYQTIPGEPPKINLVIRAERLGEGMRTYSFNQPADAKLATSIVATVERFLQEPLQIGATRQEEAQVQLRRGKEQGRVRRPPGPFFPAGVPHEDQRRATLREAVRALESAVFLDPDCDEAKAYLGFCLMDPALMRAEEGRSYLLEVRAATTNRELYRLAGALLVADKGTTNPVVAVQIYEAGHDAATNIVERSQESEKIMSLYRRMAQMGQLTPDENRARVVQLWRGDLTNAARRVSLQDRFYVEGLIDKMFKGLTGTFADDAVANAYLEKVMPEVEKAAPVMNPYLVAGWVRTIGTNGSAELGKRYSQLLTVAETTPERLAVLKSFFAESLPADLYSLLEIKNYELALRVAELLSVQRHHLRRDEQDRVDYVRAHLWRARGEIQKSLDACGMVGDRDIRFNSSGLWGPAGVYSARRIADSCRVLLGSERDNTTQPVAARQRLPAATLSFSTNIEFAVDGPRVWMIAADKLYTYDKQQRQLTTVPLPQANLNMRGIAVTAEDVWLGTQGQGLFAARYGAGPWRRYTVTNGLLQNYIRSLYAGPEALWVGFGQRGQNVGGFGYFTSGGEKFRAIVGELATNLTATPLTGAMSPRLTKGDAPHQGGIGEFAQSSLEEVFLTSFGRLYRLSVATGKWQWITNDTSVSSIAVNDRFLVAGCSAPNAWQGAGPDRWGGLSIYDRATSATRALSQADGFLSSPIHAVAIDGDEAWAGGAGFIAHVSLPEARIKKLFLIDAHLLVDRIELDTTQLWFSAESKEKTTGSLFELPLE